MNVLSKIGIGTVQFGVDYGISNKSGITSTVEVKNILESAILNKINTIDTAYKYGSSHKALATTQLLSQFEVITKLGVLERAEDMEKHVREILIQLNLSSVDGLMFHSCDDLKIHKNNFKELSKIKTLGLAKKIGVSVYDAEEIDFILDHFEFDLVQLPIGILNQGLLKSGHLEKLKKRGVEVHARSLFLQGLVFMDPKNVASYFNEIVPKLEQFREYQLKNNISALALSISFLKELKDVDKFIFGVNNLEQLTGIINAFEKLETESIKINYNDFDLVNDKYTDPRKWDL